MGYPSLLLSPVSLELPSRQNVTSATIRRKVEAWEASRRERRGFEMRSMDRAPLFVAQESASVYVSLREHFPTVAPSYVDIASPLMQKWYGHLKNENQPLAVAYTFEELAPLRQHSPWRVSPLAVLEDADIDDAEAHRLELIAEFWEASGVRDIYESGSIDLSPTFGSVRGYRELLSYRARPRRPHPSRTPSAIQHTLTPLSYALVHEFGHLLDAEVQMLGQDALEHVYGALSVGVLDLDAAPSVREHSRHLANFPTDFSLPGRESGGKKRQAWWRRRAAEQIAPVLGRYATTNRDELFAESLVASFAAKDPSLRRALRPFRQALRDVGLHRARRT